MKKECNYCHEIKSFDEYFNSSTSADRKAYRCKACTVKLRWEWCKNNPEKYRAQLDRRKVSKTHLVNNNCDFNLLYGKLATIIY